MMYYKEGSSLLWIEMILFTCTVQKQVYWRFP